jgi:transketolase
MNTNPKILYKSKLLNLYKDANCGHIACSLSCIDILYSIFKHKNESDSFILSKGHAAGALYTILNLIGEISDDELRTFYKNGTKLSAHPSANSFPNIPFALGSLGHGFPISCGIAMSNKLMCNDFKTYVLMSDGETNEGTTWEAAHFAVANSLSNLILIIDKNRLQGFGKTEDVLGDTAERNKWESIGFDVVEIDGHNLEEIQSALNSFKIGSKPKLVIANTIKGKDVSYMENKLEWHYLPMNDLQFQEAINDINKIK